MSVSWITAIYNNTDEAFYMWARDRQHLGVFTNERGTEVGRNDDNAVLTIPPGAAYTADWAGIPWYADEKHYRAISTTRNDRSKALVMWQTIVEGRDGVALIDGSTMKGIAHIQFGIDADHRYALFIEDVEGNTEISLELRNTNDTSQRIIRLMEAAAGDLYDDLRQIRVEAGKAAIGALAP
jgi:hypothetical protein